MTGFRVHRGGAQALFGVTPDLTTLGKVIGGGLPIGAYGGRRDIMEMVAPSGPVYQAGTLSGNPLAMRAGIETLDALLESGVWEHLDRTAAALSEGLGCAAQEAAVPVRVSRVGTMFTLFFTTTAPHDWPTVRQCDASRFSEFFRQMLRRGVYLAPSPFEAGFLSTAHDDQVIQTTLDAARDAFAGMAAA